MIKFGTDVAIQWNIPIVMVREEGILKEVGKE